jgi:hypothetical protein
MRGGLRINRPEGSRDYAFLRDAVVRVEGGVRWAGWCGQGLPARVLGRVKVSSFVKIAMWGRGAAFERLRNI